MLRMTATLLCAALLAGCATAGQQAATDYNQQITALNVQAEAGKISHVEHARRAAELTRQYHPQDYRLQALREAKVYLATQYEAGKLTREEYEYQWEQKRLAYLANRQDRQDAQEQNSSLVGMQGAQILNDSIQRSLPRAPVNCTSTNSFGVVNTTCR